MKAVYQKLTASPDEGFAVREIRGTGFGCPWHYHPEFELILVLHSRGYRMVGDNVATLEPGDLVLVGPNLPHIWQQDESLPVGSERVHAIVVQFEDRFLTGGWLQLPALAAVRRLLARACLGLHVRGAARDRAQPLLRDLVKLRGLPRIIAFLTLLHVLAESEDCRALASPGFTAAQAQRPFDQDRMNRVCQHINAHLEEPIALPQLARLVHLSNGAFSRFFRKHMGKTFPAFVNELRIGRACRLLTETDLPVTEIGLSAGFTNLSNFNRQFLRMKRMAPQEFRRRFARGG